MHLAENDLNNETLWFLMIRSSEIGRSRAGSHELWDVPKDPGSLHISSLCLQYLGHSFSYTFNLETSIQTSQTPSNIKLIKHYPQAVRETCRDPQLFIMEKSLFQKPWNIPPYIWLGRNWLGAHYKPITSKRKWDYHKWFHNWFIRGLIPAPTFPESITIMSLIKSRFS